MHLFLGLVSYINREYKRIYSSWFIFEYVNALMKQTEKHVQFTPDSYRDYNLPANTRLFLLIFGYMGGMGLSWNSKISCVRWLTNLWWELHLFFWTDIRSNKYSQIENREIISTKLECFVQFYWEIIDGIYNNDVINNYSFARVSELQK